VSARSAPSACHALAPFRSRSAAAHCSPAFWVVCGLLGTSLGICATSSLLGPAGGSVRLALVSCLLPATCVFTRVCACVCPPRSQPSCCGKAVWSEQQQLTGSPAWQHDDSRHVDNNLRSCTRTDLCTSNYIILLLRVFATTHSCAHTSLLSGPESCQLAQQQRSESTEAAENVFAVSMCTTTGQRCSYGDVGQEIVIGEISAALNYCLVLEQELRQLVDTHRPALVTIHGREQLA
jgi:hypothetical protein